SLGTSYYNIGEKEQGAQSTAKAYELRVRVSERERFYIESHYHAWVTGNLEKGRQGYELWAQTYPRDWVAHNNLGVTYFNFGQYDPALQEISAALQLNPGDRLVNANIVNAHLYLNHLEDAKAAARQAQAKGLDSPFLRTLLYQIAFLENDTGGMAKQVVWSAGKPDVEDVLLAQEADTAAYSGHLSKAREFSDQAAAAATQAHHKEAAAAYQAEAALREALFGNTAEARQRAVAALGLSSAREVMYGAALALAIAGDTSAVQVQVEKLADDLAKRFPEDTLVGFNYLPTLHAQLALNRKNAVDALKILQTASPCDLSTTATHFNFIGFYPVFVRGEAYLAAHRGSEAASEFQKIVDHRGIVANLPIGALAQLGLARAYALDKQTDKARSAYGNFLSLWHEADTDIPILKEAKAEFAKLQ
ncbi:MAG: hypothetical protein JO249_02855, partial [Acidobacteria bacterium]|nr:hypothetical protein [Acidobacteriota bacterium]